MTGAGTAAAAVNTMGDTVMLDMLDGLLSWTAHSKRHEVWAGPSWPSYALQVRSLLFYMGSV
jgi:hypothetical protein